MLAASKIGSDCNFIGFYLVVEEMWGFIVWDACNFSQVGMLEYFSRYLMVDIAIGTVWAGGS